ncbi:Glyoxalase/Bleomycin resistance protein/Dihydroxybiphenyl dioxygenase [Rhypophila decipiens]|uniref:Glyoxalase/Bleomycin resistance protein/Dihydroxybiphenyl dioxygenase n=1 Tax=Rhypophila decipiens TaxID=261697 RepID=A0AAN6Y3Y1_9PEZI|nr:Glyoxalase/Bleomycin resistance protein/Dihydroxybiphenyl dioxygenase [Rhypophila decipiens]
MSINHVGLSVGPSAFKKTRDFYLATLQPLGYIIFMENNDKDACVSLVGFKNAFRDPNFWVHAGGDDGNTTQLVDPENYKTEELKKKQPVRTHVAFTAPSRRVVDEWHSNALKSGAIDNGPPGERIYVKGYYAAYVIDPVGNNIEVVHYNPWCLQAIKVAPSIVSLLAGIVGGVLAYHYAG